MRHSKFHRVFRVFSDPLLLLGIAFAIVRVRLRFIVAVRAGLVAMPEDPLMDLLDAQQRAEHMTAPTPPAQADAAAAGNGYVPPYADVAPTAAATVDNVSPIRPPHVPHVEPVLADALSQLHAAG